MNFTMIRHRNAVTIIASQCTYKWHSPSWKCSKWWTFRGVNASCKCTGWVHGDSILIMMNHGMAGVALFWLSQLSVRSCSIPPGSWWYTTSTCKVISTLFQRKFNVVEHKFNYGWQVWQPNLNVVSTSKE
jgi:hypothetical protein